MSSAYDALNARAQGLRSHLFTRAELEDLALLSNPEALGRALLRSGRLASPVPPAASVAAAETAVRRSAAAHLHTLQRWATSGEGALEIFFAEEERRILRAMLRGAVQGAPASARLEGLIPTPGLPEPVLKELARQPTVASVISQLVVLGRPEVTQLLPLAAHAEPALFAVELALLRAWAERARAAAKRSDANVRRYVALRIDVLLAELALLLAAGPHDVDPDTCFVEGGRHLKRDVFVAAAKLASRADAVDRLAKGLAATPLKPLFAQRPIDPAQLERSAQALFLSMQRSEAKRDPLCSAPLMRMLLLLQSTRADLLRIAWGVAFGAPASLTRPELVTPWS